MASAPKFKSLKIDILHPAGSMPKLWHRALKWMISSGRYIVVVAEIIVIGAFISRYKLDADLTDIQNGIKEQIPYIQSLKKDEETIRQVHFQLASVKEIHQNTPNWNKVVTQIANLTPKNTTLTKIVVDRTQEYPKTVFTISGQASTNGELAVLIKGLQTNPIFNNVNLTSLTFDRQLVVFTISGGVNIANEGIK